MRKVRNIVINGGLVLIILIVVAVLYKYNPGGGKKAGTVSIQSNISGATIFMNGNKLKRFAPDTLSNVSLGSHYITLFKEGYNTYPPMQVVHVKNKKTSEVSFSLKSAPKLAPVKIKVNIPDFNLYIDGLKTPLKKGSLVEVPIGYHNFMVVKKGYISKPTYQRQLISQSDTVELRFNLTADPELAYLQVSNNLFEGYVYLDNQFTGMQAIGDVMPVKAGSYEVRIRKNGYRCVPDSQFVHVSPGEERLIVFRLKKISRSQPFRIRTQEPGAAIFIDGEFFPFVTPVDELMLSPGLHFLNLARNSKQLSKLDKPFKTNSQQENNLYFRF